MTETSGSNETWPALPYEAWGDTHDTLHLYTQVVGKVKLALCPFLNHWWEVGFTLTARGLTTGPIPWRGESFDIEFDFIDHRLVMRISDGRTQVVSLEPRSVAEFYRLVMAALATLGIEVAVNTTPSEMPDPTPFEQDTVHTAYDGASVQRWWRVMLGVSRVLERFRTPFRGKSSPVLFYWGGFDLNSARFSGKLVPPPTQKGRIMEYGEDAENFAAGFWPGASMAPMPVLYAYLSPAPAAIASLSVEPAGAHFEQAMGEFVLPYEEARTAPSPDEAIMTFFQSVYDGSARLAGWDRATLEGHVPALAHGG